MRVKPTLAEIQARDLVARRLRGYQLDHRGDRPGSHAAEIQLRGNRFLESVTCSDELNADDETLNMGRLLYDGETRNTLSASRPDTTHPPKNCLIYL